ncbi:hypothetical protein RB598_002793 [Gaeumannomyces tritici]
MADEELLDKVHSLSDLELAALLCLVSRENCLISTTTEALDDLVAELQLISSRTFGLKSVIVECGPHTTLEDFATGLLLPSQPSSPATARTGLQPGSGSGSPYARSDSYFLAHAGGASPVLRPGGTVAGLLTPPAVASGSSALQRPTLLAPSVSSGYNRNINHSSANSSNNGSGSGRLHPVPGPGAIANVVIARGLDRAPRAVQIQALELLRTRRIFTRTTVQAAPKPFLLVAALEAQSGGRAHVTPHLNDHFYIAHWHDPEDGFVNLEEQQQKEAEIGAGLGGRAGSSTDGAGYGTQQVEEPLLSDADIGSLARASQEVQMDIDVLRYLMNIASFLRVHRAVASGVTPTSTKHFERLAKCMAALHRLDYVTPSLVAMAAKKIYLHRIRIVEPSKERSMQWGSELSAIETMLEETGPEEVMEDVLSVVTPPL